MIIAELRHGGCGAEDVTNQQSLCETVRNRAKPCVTEDRILPGELAK